MQFRLPVVSELGHQQGATAVRGCYVSPEHFVQLTTDASCQGTSISFNEPTLSLEWSLEVFRLSRSRGLYNTFVTNGYMTPESLSLLIDAGLDAMNVDIKGDAEVGRKYCKTINVEKVWSACKAGTLAQCAHRSYDVNYSRRE